MLHVLHAEWTGIVDVGIAMMEKHNFMGTSVDGVLKLEGVFNTGTSCLSLQTTLSWLW